MRQKASENEKKALKRQKKLVFLKKLAIFASYKLI